MKRKLKSKIIIFTVASMIFSAFPGGMKYAYAKETNSLKTDTSYYDNAVKSDNVAKLADLEEKLYRCILSGKVFDLYTYVPDEEFDQFVNDNNIELSCESDLEGLTNPEDIYRVKRFYLCKWIFNRVKETRCFYGYSYVNFRVKYTKEYDTPESYNTGAKNSVDEKLDYIVNNFKEKYIKDDYTDYEKEAAVVSYLINSCQYDYDLFGDYLSGSITNYEGFYAIGALINNKAVCSGYAEACQVLFDSIGIECHTITSRELDHAWNVVKIDGKYYQLDVTWIDCNDISDFSFFNFSNEETMHQANDLVGKEWCDKCTNNFGDESVREYSITLNKVLKIDENNNYYLEDLYGNNRQELNLSSEKVSQAWVDENYLYYMKYEDEKYRLYKFNLVTNENELLKELDEYHSFFIHCENIVVEDNNNVEIEDIKIKDKLQIPEYHTVTFKFGDDIQEIQRVKDGDTVIAPTSNLYKEGWTFTKWEDSVNNPVTEDIIINAEYSINKVTVTFKDYDGTVIETQVVDAGSDVSSSSNPVRNDYIFMGWKLPGAYYIDSEILKNVTKDITVEAEYKTTLIAQDSTYDGVDGITIYGVNSEAYPSNKLEIPEEYLGKKVQGVVINNLPENITEIVLPKEISVFIVSDCENLNSVVFSGTQYVAVAIDNCPNLVVTLPKGSLVEQFIREIGCKYVVVDNGSSNDNNQKGDEDINKPGDEDTSKPGDEDTSKPGDEDTSKPGDEDISKPGDEDTSKPDEKDDQGTSGSENKPNTGDNSRGLILIGIMTISLVIVIRRKRAI